MAATSARCHEKAFTQMAVNAFWMPLQIAEDMTCSHASNEWLNAGGCSVSRGILRVGGVAGSGQGTGANNESEVTGWYYDANGVAHGFLRQ